MPREEIDAIRAMLAEKPRPVGWAERRARLDEVGSVSAVAGDIRCEPVDCGGVPGEWSLAPGSDSSRVLLFFHGGGYCAGSIVSHRRMATEAGRAAGMRTLAIGYRLAPEDPYPAAHEDALAAWRFLRGQGVAAGAVALGGDSAGGNLALALLQRLRQAGETGPVCLWLASPWTDLTRRDACDEGRRRSAHPQGLSRRARRRLRAGAARPRRPADLAALRRSFGLPADADPGWVGRDAACRRDAPCRRDGRGRRRRHARSVAAHDPCWLLWNARLAEGRRALARAGAFMRR